MYNKELIKNFIQENILDKDKSIHIDIDLENLIFNSCFGNTVDICYINGININVDNTGVLSHIFKEITLNISIRHHSARTTDEHDVYLIVLDYQYEHPSGGTNGYTVNYYCNNNQKFVLD